MSDTLTSDLGLEGLNHFTIRCLQVELEALRSFYRDVLGMQEGPRPAFPFQGHWMYVGDRPVVHLAAIATEAAAAPDSAGSGFDHVSLSAMGLEATRRRLGLLRVPYEEAPVPGWPLHQVFLRDPVGSKIELTFKVQA